jgi:membrane fusion protein (multidrug efflux system)
MKKSPRLIRIVIVVVLALLGVGIYVFLHRGQESTDDAAFDAHTVVLSSKVTGYVKTLNINDNQFVKAGDVLLEIDPKDYIIRRDRAAAVLEAAQAAASGSKLNLDVTNISAPSNLSAADAQVMAAQANLDKANSDLSRMQHLSNEARSQQQLDVAIAAEKTARSNLEDAQAKQRSAATAPNTIAAAQATSDQLAAQVKQAEADLAQAEDDLANTKIIAPMDGRITGRGVERGDYIQPGQQLAILVGSDVWVVANFKETQLQHMQPGQRVKIRVDAFPNADIEGKVDSIQSGTGARFSAFPPENATGNFVKVVQRVPVKILLTQKPDEELSFGPGMSVTPTVYTQDQ